MGVIDDLTERAMTVQVEGADIDLRVPDRKQLVALRAHQSMDEAERDKIGHQTWTHELFAMALMHTWPREGPQGRAASAGTKADLDQWVRIYLALDAKRPDPDPDDDEASDILPVVDAALRLHGVRMGVVTSAMREVIKDRIAELDEEAGDLPT